MLGSIIGDIVGSIYEFNNIKTKSFPLFRPDCFFTDDTVMTIAVADAIMNGGSRDDFVDSIKKYGRLYPHESYGISFRMWLRSDTRKPYGSFGNGSAMRVAPCGWMPELEECRRLARASAEVTHNHPEGVKGALAVADAIYICRQNIANGGSPAECRSLVKNHVEKEYGYDLHRTCDEIRPTYEFNETCQETVPQAIVAFLDSTDFEDAIRNAISLGGDSDTLAAITGSIAEAAYGVPEWIREKAFSYLDETLLGVFERWEKYLVERGKDIPMTESITQENQKLNEAIIFAVNQHAGQLRKGTSRPYILHPIEVLQILHSMKADMNLMIAGVLHDTVEDTSATVDEIRERFGEDVAALVAAHSEDKSKTWDERKTFAIEELRTADKRLKMLVMADKLSNMRSIESDYNEIGEELWNRFNAPFEKQQWYYTGIKDALCDMANYPETRKCYSELVGIWERVFR